MTGGFTGYLAELRRRKVFRVGVVYLIVAWLVIQIAEVVIEPLRLPDWSLTFIIVVAILGLPLALVLSWGSDQKDPEETTEELPVVEPESAEPEERLPSVAVLPFVDMSPDKDQDYFCEGISEEILNTLTRIKNLDVASRTSSFRFKNQTADISEIGRELHVGTVLEGSVRKSGDQLRVTAQLIEVTTGFHLWSEKFDSRLENVFAIQDHIAGQIAEALKVTLTPAGAEPVYGERTADVEAYDLYLRGWKFFHAFGRKNFESARQMFQRAIEVDPEYAMAWAGLADAAAFLYLYVDEREELRQETVKASEKALALSDDIAETHASRGLGHLLSKEYDQAIAFFERAIAINPRLFEPYYFYARTCVHQGDYQRAAEYYRKAHEADPADYQSALLLAQVYAELDQPDEAQKWRKRGVELALRHLETNPDDVRAMYMAGSKLAAMGETEQGVELGERALTIDPDDSVVLYNVACVYSMAGRLDQALDCLERVNLDAMAVGGWIKSDSDFKPLRGHPRFEALLARIDSRPEA